MPLSNFSQKADEYDSQALVQYNSAKALIEQTFKHVKAGKIKIADLGCGTGALGKILQEKLPDFTLDNCDISEPMLKMAEQVLGDKNIQYQNCSIPKDADYDLIVSNFALQWYDDLNHTIEVCIEKLNIDGLMAISLPVAGSFAILEEAFKYADAEDFFFNFPRIAEIKHSLNNCEIISEESVIEDIEFDSTFEVFKNLHTIGANQKDKQLPAHKLRKLIRYHDELFDGKIIVIYKIYKLIVKRVS